jgi:hypothetical protein
MKHGGGLYISGSLLYLCVASSYCGIKGAV